MSRPPRKPGSQVAPNAKPLITDRRTATTHHKVNPEIAYAGQLFRVRDQDWKQVHGEDLSWADAKKLKETVVGLGRSRNAIVAPMDEEVHAEYQVHAESDPSIGEDLGGMAYTEDASAPPITQPPAAAPRPPSYGAEIVVDQPLETVAPCDGTVTRIPPNCMLWINGERRDTPARVMQGGQVTVVAIQDPILSAAREAALAAARPVAAAANARIAAAPPPKDITVKATPPRTAPPPKDITTSHRPPIIRLTPPPSSPAQPPPSPLRVATMADGDPLPDGALADDSLPDLVSDLGGHPSEADLEHAKRERDAAR